MVKKGVLTKPKSKKKSKSPERKGPRRSKSPDKTGSTLKPGSDPKEDLASDISPSTLSPSKSPNRRKAVKDEREMKLRSQVAEVQTVLDQERKARDLLAQERDQLQSYWNVTRERLDKHKADVWLSKRELETAHENYEHKSRYLEKKIKYLIHKQQENVAVSMQEQHQALQVAKETFADSDMVREATSSTPDVPLHQLEANTKAAPHKASNAEQERDTDFIQEMRLRQAAFDSQVRSIREEVQAKLRDEMQKQEREKVVQFEEIRSRHEQKIVALEKEFRSLIDRTSEQNFALHEKCETLQRRLDEKTELLANATSGYEKLADEVRRLLDKNSALELDMQQHSKIKKELETTMKELRRTKKSLTDLEFQHETLIQKFQAVEKERRALYQQMAAAVSEVDDTARLKKNIIEQQIHELRQKIVQS